MGPNQTPQLGLFGRRPESLLARTPFDTGFTTRITTGTRGASATRRARW
ncbi:hypothetical protein ACF1HJ_29985 [Streptomyces sp. NPDC013978]